MAPTVIAMDIGTSGIRAQAVDLATRKIISTTLTTRHPLPGGNVIDHIHFSLELGAETSRSLLIRAIDHVIKELRTPLTDVERFAVCGNPAQISLFTGDEIRDLAFTGKRKLDALGVTIPERKARILAAGDFPGLNLPASCKVIIPPAVSHEIGADALALIIKTGMRDSGDYSIAIDYGTNAEMALCVGGNILTGSTAAGPALEGQQISCGILAVPGAISDLTPEPPYHRVIQLDSGMLPVNGALVDMATRGCIHSGDAGTPLGITGTGTIAAFHEGLDSGIVQIPRIMTDDHRLHLGNEYYLDEDDLVEAGKAIGAIRAGYLTLCHEAGIKPEDIRTVYMSGAAGTYVDAKKAQQLGLLPPAVQTIYQVGNTSLAMARDLVMDEGALETMTSLAERLKPHHCLFASSAAFKNIYILEFSYWTEGMPMSLYRSLLKKYRLPDLPPVSGTPEIIRTVRRDIDDLGQMDLVILDDIGTGVHAGFGGCTACGECITECPEHAITPINGMPDAPFTLDPSRCLGVACRLCERACPEKVFSLNQFFLPGTPDLPAGNEKEV